MAETEPAEAIYPCSPKATRRYARGPHGQVHWYDGPAEGRPVLLLHQAPTSAIDFAKLFPGLSAAGRRFIAPDLPGMGMSDPPPAPPVIDDYAEAMLAVLDDAGAPQVDVIGHHTGAQVALRLARRAPERVGRLVLYGAGLLGPDARQALWESIVPREREEGAFDPKSGGEHLKALFLRLEALFGPIAAQRMVISRLLAGPLLWYAHNAALTHDMAPDLIGDRHSLLFVTHDGEMLDDATREAARLRPDARLAVLPERCAVAFNDRPEAFLSAVLAFLDESSN